MKLRTAIGLAVLLAGCGKPSSNGGATLRADLVGDIADTAGAPRRAIAAATAQGLVGFDGAGQVVPALATSWRIADDGLSVIFRLRPATWPDGKPVTANDVVAALRRAASPAGKNPLRPLLAGLENGDAVIAGDRPATTLGVDAPVENVVEVRLAGAMPELLQLLAQPDMAIVRTGSKPLATGPFKLVDAAARPIVLDRNPAYKAPAEVTIGGMSLNPVDDPGAAIARFARDRTDVVTGSGIAGFSDARLLSASNALRVELSWGVYGYVANVRSGPLADPRVRRALAMSIDRDDLGSRLFGVALAPVLGLLPTLPSEPVPALPDWAIQAPAARLELARQLLAAAGFTPQAPLTVTISLPSAREHATVAAEVAADWAQLGVRTLTVTRTPARHLLAVARGNFELALVERTAPADSPLFFLLPFGCAAKTGGYCNAGADGLMAAARTTADPAGRATTLGLAEAAMVADTPLIALFVPIRWSLVARRVTGWIDNPAGQHPLARLGIAPGRELTLP